MIVPSVALDVCLECQKPPPKRPIRRLEIRFYQMRHLARQAGILVTKLRGLGRGGVEALEQLAPLLHPRRTARIVTASRTITIRCYRHCRRLLLEVFRQPQPR